MKLTRAFLCAAAGLTLMHGSAIAQTQLAEDDQEFLRKAGESGMLEIQASEIAVQRSQHPEVKSYAEMMIKDHTAVDKELKKLAESKGFTLPSQLEGDKQDLLENLRQLEGPSFDDEYVDEVAIDAHEDAVDLFEDAADDAEDADIKAFAAKHLPSLKKHLEMGEQLEEKVDESDNNRNRSAATGTTAGEKEGSVVIPGTDAQPKPKQ